MKKLKRGRPASKDPASTIVRLRVQPGKKIRWKIAAGGNLSRWMINIIDRFCEQK